MGIAHDATERLRRLLAIPADYQIFFVASSTEAMERIIQNTAAKRTHHFVNGAFSEVFFTLARQLGKQATEHRVPWGQGFTAEDMVVPDDAELVTFTHNESGTGAMLDLAYVYDYKKAHPDTIVALDVVSSAPIVTLDFKFLDCIFFSVQKGFGLPAGLGVLIVSPAALARAAQLAVRPGYSTGSYHSFANLSQWAVKDQTPETPNVLGVYLLGRVAAAMEAEGIEHIRKRVTDRAASIYKVIDDHPTLKPFVARPEHRSSTIISVDVSDSARYIAPLAEQGLLIGGGYGDYQSRLLRIANFPAVSDEQMQELLAVLPGLR